MAEVRFKAVGKTFGQVKAVRDFFLDIADGEFIVLVGPSGCGKSTLLRLAAGLEEISSGEIYIGDRLVNDVHPSARDVAMVFQNYALYPQMTVYQNMSFCLEMRRVSQNQIKDKVRGAARLLGLEHLLERKPRQLSGGQRQRVALGRAIVRNPRVFLFDEPLSNLDAKLRIAMRAELLDLHQRLKTTTIYVTHDQLEAMTMGDRIVVLKDGVMQQADSPQHVYDHPVNMFVAGFIGAPAMNFLDCEIMGEKGEFRASTANAEFKLPRDKAAKAEAYLGRRAVLGLRPEHIDDAAGGRQVEPGSTFKGSVWVVEPVGSEKIVHVRCGEDVIVARLDPYVTCRPGDMTEFRIRSEHLHLFDQESGLTIF
ncbi:MAG: sn-glycerol-3-phosphate ABC transporter ATP-binding protein UgpC [Thermodesulfobacteriota bacterium]